MGVTGTRWSPTMSPGWLRLCRISAEAAYLETTPRQIRTLWKSPPPLRSVGRIWRASTLRMSSPTSWHSTTSWWVTMSRCSSSAMSWTLVSCEADSGNSVVVVGWTVGMLWFSFAQDCTVYPYPRMSKYINRTVSTSRQNVKYLHTVFMAKKSANLWLRNCNRKILWRSNFLSYMCTTLTCFSACFSTCKCYNLIKLFDGCFPSSSM